MGCRGAGRRRLGGAAAPGSGPLPPGVRGPRCGDLAGHLRVRGPRHRCWRRARSAGAGPTLPARGRRRPGRRRALRRPSGHRGRGPRHLVPDPRVGACHRTPPGLLHPWTSYLIIPVFALANAGIAVSGPTLSDAATSPVRSAAAGERYARASSTPRSQPPRSCSLAMSSSRSTRHSAPTAYSRATPSASASTTPTDGSPPLPSASAFHSCRTTGSSRALPASASSALLITDQCQPVR